MKLLLLLKRYECALLSTAAFGLPLLSTSLSSLNTAAPHSLRLPLLELDIKEIWSNTILTLLLFTFWCMLLEFRRRRLNELIESVATVEEETRRLLEVEPNTKEAAEACLRLLDTTFQRYDKVQMLLDDRTPPGDAPEQHNNSNHRLQHPPIIEESSTEI